MVGLVRGVHGLHGAVRVEVLTDRPEERFAPGARLYVEGSSLPMIVAEGVPVADGPGWRIRFQGRSDRTMAEPLQGMYLEAEAEPPPGAEDGAVWWHEVIGSQVLDRDGRVLGAVQDVYRAGGAEVYAVDGGSAGPFDVPAVRAIILEFAPREGRIVIDTDALGIDPDAAARSHPRGRRTTRAARAGPPS